GIGIGWMFAARLSDAVVLLAVGVIAVGFVLINWRRNAVLAAAEGIKPSTLMGWFWGAVAGLTSFVAHAGGPPFQVYVLPQRLPPQLYAGTNTMFFAATNLVKLIPYAMLGQLSSANLTLAGALFPFAIAATFAGVWLVRRIDANRFYAIVYALTAAVGLKLIWDGGFRLFG
ncbi:MAG: sulfite exporter TauE/SafE family protein, partial [Beijerinckiaceae bacterium]|nr:sulfite exporter TauE/SafE family protein [Beijerinckiaceae bacterium]